MKSIRPIAYRFVCCLLLAVACLGSQSKVHGDDQPTDSGGAAIELSQPGLWQTLDGRPAEENWEFADGEIRLTNPRGGGGSLISEPLPANFELSWQWKIEKGSNTGLKYRVRRFGQQLFSNKFLGIEYQIIDDAGDKVDKGSTASIYDLVAPAKPKTLQPIGEWNQARIIASGNRIEHYLNGELIAEAFTTGPQWDQAIALSKFFGSTEFGTPGQEDRLMLTDHGGKAAYRNFKFIVLQPPPADTQRRTSQGPFLGNGMRNSWADQDSIVIWTRTTAKSEMKADGIPFISLSTKQARKLSKQTDVAQLHAAQMPEGATLSEMFGACPGAPGRVRLTYFPGKQRYAAKSTEWVKTSADQDFTAQWKIEGLKPGTRYAAVIEACDADSDQVTAVVRGGFQTAPSADEREPVRFCFTTCHDFIRRDDGMKGHRIYPSMTKMDPNFVVHAGDIEYYDKPDPWAMTLPMMRFKWSRIFSLPNNRAFYSGTTSYFLKDDHDTLKNDCWAGQTYGAVSFEEGQRLFNEEQFPSHPKRYKTVSWGKDLQVWFLEGRDYRSPNDIPDGPEKTILGEAQKAWLFKTLNESTATFKVICSPTPIVGPDRKNKKDNHANDVFEFEGEQIRETLSEIENAIVLCGDRHWQYASYDEDADLWEFGCGPGSADHELGWKPGDERPMHRFLRVKGGFLSGQLKYVGEQETPQLIIRHHRVDGSKVSQFDFPTP